MDTRQILKSVSQNVLLNKDEEEFFLSILEPSLFRRKDFVLIAGDVCRFQTFVNKGCLKVFYTDHDGNEHIVKFAVENWWSVDLESFSNQSPAFYSIQALEDTDTWQIRKSNYDLLLERVPKFEKFTRLQFQNSYILLQHRMTQHLYSKGEDKYDQFNKKYPGLEQRIAQKEIASYLGITPEFLSMLRKKSMKGIIS
jgi:CRP-like cAMP-binding protein